jgi:hypothetical protein
VIATRTDVSDVERPRGHNQRGAVHDGRRSSRSRSSSSPVYSCGSSSTLEISTYSAVYSTLEISTYLPKLVGAPPEQISTAGAEQHVRKAGGNLRDVESNEWPCDGAKQRAAAAAAAAAAPCRRTTIHNAALNTKDAVTR